MEITNKRLMPFAPTGKFQEITAPSIPSQPQPRYMHSLGARINYISCSGQGRVFVTVQGKLADNDQLVLRDWARSVARDWGLPHPTVEFEEGRI